MLSNWQKNNTISVAENVSPCCQLRGIILNSHVKYIKPDLTPGIIGSSVNSEYWEELCRLNELLSTYVIFIQWTIGIITQLVW